ncbi:MAG TPA: hypothetical protein VJG13_01965 [Thermoanaerobaculia bacterium]|jgi:hypothetical protein|nr:hypothetical protein [Thermoanaerobaculia bacterium]
MRSSTFLPAASIVLSALGLVALLVAHLALVDIWHGSEPDLGAEWLALRGAFAILALSSAVGIAAAARVLRAAR